MAQHDQVIDNGSGLTVRTDFNAAIAALFSNSSGPVEPSVTVAGQFWFDTGNASNPVLRQRNLANTGWLTIIQGGQAAIDIATGKRAGPPKDTFVWNDKADMSGTDVMTLDDTGNLTVLGKVTAADVVATTINGKPIPKVTARARNRVNNPTLQVSQERGTTGVSTPNGYLADQWLLDINGIVGAAGKVFPGISPEGTTTWAALVATTGKPSLAANDYLQLIQPIEGLDIADFDWGTPNAKQVVLRFAGMCDTAGTYAFTISNDNNTRCYCGSFTIAAANVPQAFSVAVPGDTSGTWKTDATLGLQLRFCYAIASNLVGVAGWQAGVKLAPPGCTNGAAVANKSLYITDVGLHIDPEATGVAPPFSAPSFADDLARCQRYWEKSYSMVTFPGAIDQYNDEQFVAINGSDFYSFGGVRIMVRKRTVPVLNFYAPGSGAAGYFWNCNAGVNQGTVAASRIGDSGFHLGSGNSALVASSPYAVHWVASARMI